MLGTIFNAATVAMGASFGLLLGRRVPESMRQAVFSALGLFTLYMGADMMAGISRPMAVFMALALGALLGEFLHIDQRVQRAADRLGDGQGSAIIQSTMLFCVGAMTLVGCMQDGLRDDPTVLIAKGTMDLFSSVFLAAALGRGVLWSAGAVFAIQGMLTWGFSALGSGLSDLLVQDLSGLGGILLLALGLNLLNIRSFSLLNLSCSLFLLPAVLWLLEAVGFAG